LKDELLPLLRGTCVCVVRVGMRDIMWRRKPNAGLLKRKQKWLVPNANPEAKKAD
jgi:hypothetical protein